MPKNFQVPLTLRDVKIQGFWEEILISCGYRNLQHLVFIIISISY